MKIRGYILRTSANVLLGFLKIATSLTFVWVSKLLVDIATGVSDRDLFTFIWLMAGLMLLRIALNIADNYLVEYNVQVTKITLQRDIYKRVLGSVWQGRERYHSGDISSRIHEDVRVIIDLFCHSLPALVVTVCQLVAASIFMLHLAPGLLWLMVIIMLIAAVGSKLFFRTLRRLNNHLRAKEAEAQQQIQENLLSRILVITLFGIDKVLARFDATQKDVLDTTVKKLNLGAVARASMSIGFSGTYAAAFLWGVFGIKDGSVTFGMMTAFLQLVGQIQTPIVGLVSQIPGIIKSLTSVERVLELYDMQQDLPEGEDRIDEAPAIRVSGLSYSYPVLPEDDRGTMAKLSDLFARLKSMVSSGGTGLAVGTSSDIQYREVLKDFSCEFPAGKMTAIMGPTGRGKSTLTKLIMSVLKPDAGTVTLLTSAGERPCGPEQRCNFMYVPQGNSLVSGTIRENLLLGATGKPDDEQLFSALHTAVADFVRDLPEGLDTMCGETGTGLSEGQAQRIAIARALLHRGSVLILDEATSALDAQTEQLLLERFKKACHGSRTIIFISHRDTVSREADQVINL